MSQGAFTRTRYETDLGNVVRIRLQPETLAFTDGTNTNDPPAGAVLPGWPSAKARKSEREIGIGARTITISWAGSPPAGYEGDIAVIPILTLATYNAIADDSTVTYLGTAAVVIGRSGESIR